VLKKQAGQRLEQFTTGKEIIASCATGAANNKS
jgi:hypothetical protein